MLRIVNVRDYFMSDVFMILHFFACDELKQFFVFHQFVISSGVCRELTIQHRTEFGSLANANMRHVAQLTAIALNLSIEGPALEIAGKETLLLFSDAQVI